MVTFIEVQNSLALELRGYPLASDMGIGELFKKAIVYAINLYQNKAFWFNTEIEEAYLNIEPPFSLPENYLGMLSLVAGYTGTREAWTLEKQPQPVVQANINKKRLLPRMYCIAVNSLYIAPVPTLDESVFIRLHFVKQLTIPSSDTDTSEWFDYALDLIKFTAGARLARIAWRDTQLANDLSALANIELDALEERSLNYESSGAIIPWGGEL